MSKPTCWSIADKKMVGTKLSALKRSELLKSQPCTTFTISCVGSPLHCRPSGPQWTTRDSLRWKNINFWLMFYFTYPTMYLLHQSCAYKILLSNYSLFALLNMGAKNTMNLQRIIHSTVLCIILALPFSSLSFAQSDIRKWCVDQWNKEGWSKVQYSWCVANALERQATKLKSKACNNDVCLYKLTYVDQGFFAGGGFVIRHRTNFNAGVFTSTLTLNDGSHETHLEQSCGSSCPVDPLAVSGPFKGASYTGPFGSGKSSYLILQLSSKLDRLARTTNKPTNNSTSTILKSDRSPVDGSRGKKIPSNLEGKTIEFYVEVNDIPKTKRSGQKIKTYRAQGKYRFTSNSNVYSFTPGENNGDWRDDGFIYIFGEEVDFAVERNRSPRSYEITQKSYKGLIVQEGEVLRIVGSSDNGGASEIQIHVNGKASSCRVLKYETISSFGSFLLNRQLQCSVY